MEKGKKIGKRLAQACSPCRRKKTKCDGFRPACEKCKRLGENCSYDSNSYRATTSSQMTQLESRLKNIEKVIEFISRDNNMIAPKPRLDHSKAPVIASQNKRHDLLYKTVLPNAWLEKSSVPLITMDKEDKIAEYTFDENAFPCMEIRIELAEIYFTHFRIVASVLDRASFLESVLNKTCSPFLLFSMMAVAARFSKRPEVLEDPIWMSGEKYAIKAREMIGDVIEKPTLDHIQGFLLLCFHEYGCSQDHRCWMYCGIASRMAVQMGLENETMYNIKPGTVFSIQEWLDFEKRRKTYWGAYIHDKFASIFSGKPSSLDHTQGNLLLPTGFQSIPEHDFSQQSVDQSTAVWYHLHRNEKDKVTGIEYRFIDSKNEASDTLIERGFEVSMVKGAIILGKILRFLPREGKRGLNKDLSLCKDSEFVKINQQLDDWLNQLPPDLKATSENFARCKTDNSDFTTYFVLAHVFHKSSVVLLNRPLVYMPYYELTSHESKTFIGIFLNKCISAANGVAVLLKEVSNRVEQIPPLASYLTYIVATVAIETSFSFNIHESQKAEMARREYFHFLRKMRVYWGVIDELCCMMVELYDSNKKVLEEASQLVGYIAPTTVTNNLDPFRINENNSNNNDNDNDFVSSLIPFEQQEQQIFTNHIAEDNPTLYTILDEFTLNLPSTSYNEWTPYI